MLKQYASYFTAYLISKTTNIETIERIILYGSVAKETQTKESDVDIFIELKKKTKKIENEIKKIEEQFYNSREATLFKTKGIENKLSIKTGQLKEWKELYRSIASTGIVLYGPYEAKELPSGTREYIIIFWTKIGKNRGAFLNKVYGFTTKGKHYEGILAKYEGRRIGKSCIMLPVHYKNEIYKILTAHKVEAKTISVFE